MQERRKRWEPVEKKEMYKRERGERVNIWIMEEEGAKTVNREGCRWTQDVLGRRVH
jgi:hypothetical protein